MKWFKCCFTLVSPTLDVSSSQNIYCLRHSWIMFISQQQLMADARGCNDATYISNLICIRCVNSEKIVCCCRCCSIYIILDRCAYDDKRTVIHSQWAHETTNDLCDIGRTATNHMRMSNHKHFECVYMAAMMTGNVFNSKSTTMFILYLIFLFFSRIVRIVITSQRLSIWPFQLYTNNRLVDGMEKWKWRSHSSAMLCAVYGIRWNWRVFWL